MQIGFMDYRFTSMKYVSTIRLSDTVRLFLISRSAHSISSVVDTVTYPTCARSEYTPGLRGMYWISSSCVRFLGFIVLV
jgi:hypothetical protein